MKNGQEIFTQLKSEDQLKPLATKMNDGKMVVIGGSVYHGWDISRIMTEQDYTVYKNYEDEKELKKEELRLRHSGLWECSYGYWHPKGQECGHDIQYPAGNKMIHKKVSTPADGGNSLRKIIEYKKNY